MFVIFKDSANLEFYTQDSLKNESKIKTFQTNKFWADLSVENQYWKEVEIQSQREAQKCKKE